jgi:hypothetical protein
MNKDEILLRDRVQKAVKQAMIQSKYQDEPVTFGQAIVTAQYLEKEALA